jgi:hypothetical protein
VLCIAEKAAFKITTVKMVAPRLAVMTSFTKMQIQQTHAKAWLLWQDVAQPLCHSISIAE